MEFNTKEQRLIQLAEKKVKQTALMRIVIMIVLAVSAILVLSGQLDARALSGIALMLVAVAVGQPNIVKGPSYEELLTLLQKKVK
jgi:hypothetical protein